MRVIRHPMASAIPQTPLKFTFNGRVCEGLSGDSIAAALLASGERTLRFSEKTGEPRGLYCGIGHCYECRVFLEGAGEIRACITPLEQGMTLHYGGRVEGESGN